MTVQNEFTEYCIVAVSTLLNFIHSAELAPAVYCTYSSSPQYPTEANHKVPKDLSARVRRPKDLSARVN